MASHPPGETLPVPPGRRRLTSPPARLLRRRATPQELVLRHPAIVWSLVLVSTWTRPHAYLRAMTDVWDWAGLRANGRPLPPSGMDQLDVPPRRGRKRFEILTVGGYDLVPIGGEQYDTRVDDVGEAGGGEELT